MVDTLANQVLHASCFEYDEAQAWAGMVCAMLTTDTYRELHTGPPPHAGSEVSKAWLERVLHDIAANCSCDHFTIKVTIERR